VDSPPKATAESADPSAGQNWICPSSGQRACCWLRWLSAIGSIPNCLTLPDWVVHQLRSSGCSAHRMPGSARRRAALEVTAADASGLIGKAGYSTVSVRPSPIRWESIWWRGRASPEGAVMSGSCKRCGAAPVADQAQHAGGGLGQLDSRCWPPGGALSERWGSRRLRRDRSLCGCKSGFGTSLIGREALALEELLLEIAIRCSWLQIRKADHRERWGR